MKIGIIGLGSFGQFVAGTLARDQELQILASDTSEAATPAGVQKVQLQDIAIADVVILCVPFSAYDTLLPQLAPLLRDDTLVVDICSVKIKPEKRLRKYLPHHKHLLITHPMFGPLYAKDGLEGFTLVVAEAEGTRAQEVIDYCQRTLGLKIKRMTSEEHDREMAQVHALTYLIARTLTTYGLPESEVSTPTYRLLHELTRYDKAHSEDLFRTIELGNPFAKSAREKFMKTLQQINRQLEEETV